MEGVRPHDPAGPGYEPSGADCHAQSAGTASFQQIRSRSAFGTFGCLPTECLGELLQYGVDAAFGSEAGEVGACLLGPVKELSGAIRVALPAVSEVLLRLDRVRHDKDATLLLDQSRHGDSHIQEHLI